MSAPPLSVLRHLARLNLNFSIPSRADFTVPIRIPRPGNLALSSGLIGIFALWGSTIWDSVLRAVPKKKTSYSKKRNRFLHNNKLTDITHVVSCPACGTPKKMHTLCPYCVEEIRATWKESGGAKGKATTGKSGGSWKAV